MTRYLVALREETIGAAPGVKEVEKTVQTITPATPDAPKIVETVTERHTEKMPIDAPKS